MHEQQNDRQAYETGTGVPPHDPGWRQSPPGAHVPPQVSRGNVWEMRARRKIPFVAAILSFFPGLGQIYVGYYLRGIMHFAIFASLAGILSSNAEPKPVFGLSMAFLILYNIIDAARIASLYNEALMGSDPMKLPEVKLPQQTAGGSAVLGVLLIVAGVIAFSNTIFDFSLEWLEDWWPLLPLGLGVYLVLQARRERDKKGDGARA